MTYHHLRNATAIIETETDYILVDPMLGEIGSIEAFTQKRFPALRNPLVSLPENAEALLQKVTQVLITHQHPDHLDEAGIHFLRENQLAVTCSVLDAKDLKAKGLNVVQELQYHTTAAFLGGSIEGIPATHGYGQVVELMGHVMGFYIELPGEPSLYLASDTIISLEVENVLKNYMPKVAVIACGSAQLDDYEPILMTKADLVTFVGVNSGKTICNHLEALNHCPTTRTDLGNTFAKTELSNKVWIPEDGESKQY